MSLPCDNDHFDGWHNGWGNAPDFTWPYGENGI